MFGDLFLRNAKVCPEIFQSDKNQHPKHMSQCFLEIPSLTIWPRGLYADEKKCLKQCQALAWDILQHRFLDVNPELVFHNYNWDPTDEIKKKQ